MEPDLLKFILLNCVNLRSFAVIRGTGSLSLRELLGDFQALYEGGIIRSSVASFTLITSVEFHTYRLKRADFLHIFALFPEIKRLDLEFRLYREGDKPTVYSNALSPTDFTFSCIYDQLTEMGHQLQKLRLYLKYEDEEFSWQNNLRLNGLQGSFNISRIEMENLKDLSINLPLSLIHI